MQFESSDRAKAYQTKLLHFMDECVYPAEPVYAGQMVESGRSVPRVDG